MLVAIKTVTCRHCGHDTHSEVSVAPSLERDGSYSTVVTDLTINVLLDIAE